MDVMNRVGWVLVVLSLYTVYAELDDSHSLGPADSNADLISNVRDGKSIVKRRTQPLAITSILVEPFLMLRSDSAGPLVGNDRYEGYCADLIHEIASITGFEYVIKLVKDGRYGSKNESGLWDGMIGEIIRAEADAAVAPVTISSARDRVVDFSKPFMTLGITMMGRKPSRQMAGLFSFLHIFSAEVWILLIVFFVASSLLLFFLSRLSSREWRKDDVTKNNFTLCQSLWFMLTSLFHQTNLLTPKSVSSRMLVAGWWFFSLIIIILYATNLAAFMTVERMSLPIQSIDDLAHQTSVQYGTIEGSSTANFFRSSKISTYERIWAYMESAQPSVFVNSTAEGVARVRQGNYIFLGESTTISYINSRKACDTMKIGGHLDSKGYGIVTPLGSQYRDRFNLAILELQENGILAKLEKKWWSDKSQCPTVGDDDEDKDSKAFSLSVSHIKGVLVVFVFIMICALVVGLVECIVKSAKNSRENDVPFTYQVKSNAVSLAKGTRPISC